MTTTFRKVRRDDFSMLAETHHAGEGYVISIYIGAKMGGRKTRLSIDYGTNVVTVKCAGMKSVWKFGRRGAIRLKIPNTCTFRGWDLDRFFVGAAPPRAPYAFDYVESPQRRSSG